MKSKWLKAACAVFAAIALVAAFVFLHPNKNELRECPAEPESGMWYFLAPEGAVSADGSAWQGRIRFGTDNRLLIYFLGGGVSLDEYSAARSYMAVGGDAFYFDRDDGVSASRAAGGICSVGEENPFRNWTVLLVPYTTADFHAGAGEAGYTDLDGNPAVLQHRGYTNFQSLMDLIRPQLGNPEAIMITGYSAGGFGAAMLADGIISRFPETKNITVCADGALLLHENWRGIARDRWHAPQEIQERTVSANLALDHFCALHEKYGDGVKILFTSSLRDGALAKYQNYMDGGTYAATEEYGDIYRRNLQEMVREMQMKIPDCGIFIWDGIAYSKQQGSLLTKHTILYSDAFFLPLCEDMSIAQWMADAAEGRVENYGLSLLEES